MPSESVAAAGPGFKLHVCLRIEHVRHRELGLDAVDLDAHAVAHVGLRYEHHEVLDVRDALALVADVLDVHDVLLAVLDRNWRV